MPYLAHKRYVQRYFHFSSHWVGYLTLKKRLVLLAILAVVTLAHINKFHEKIVGIFEHVKGFRFRRYAKASISKV